MWSRRNVKFQPCRISKYIQLIKNLVTDGYTVIFKRMSTVKGHRVDVYTF